MKTAFLLGAGASKDAGLPLACEITEKVLNDEYKPQISENLPNRPLTSGTPARDYQCVMRFLRWLSQKVEFALAIENHSTNYEDLAYLAGQILDHLRGEFENPAIYPLIKELLRHPDFLPPSIPDRCRREKLEQLSEKTIEYIHNRVQCALMKWPTVSELEYLRFIIESPNDPISKIFTLNNDTLIEQFLLGKGKNFIDGFYPPITVKDRVPAPPHWGYWKPELLIDQAEPGTIRLFKMHGSVNWFRWRENGEDKIVRIGINKNALKEYLKLPVANRPDGNMPQLLIGTFNKMLRYTNALYLPLYYGFYRQLQATDTLIVCGYSFGDKGINQQIVYWMDGNSNRRMAVINYCVEGEQKIWKYARGAITQGKDRWGDRLHLFLEKKLKCVDWREIWSELA